MISIRSSVAVTVLLTLLPLLTSATSQPLTDDTGTTVTTDSTYCPHLTSTFKRRATEQSMGGQVTELQKFLTDYYNLADNALTGGFFGRLTQQYVMQFQTEQSLPAFGIVGSLTRATIARVCGGTTPSQSCTFNNQTITNGSAVTAYYTSPNDQCLTQQRTCTNGVLSGTYTDLQCNHVAPTSTASLTATPNSGTAPLTVQFAVSPAYVQNYMFDFGDGQNANVQKVTDSTGTGVHTSHTYKSVGTYVVKLSESLGSNESMCSSYPNCKPIISSVTITITM